MDTTIGEQTAQTKTQSSRPHWQRWELLAVATVGLVLIAGLGSWVLLGSGTPADDSAEAGFARDMSIHHAQAVEMSLIVQQRTENPDVQVLATDILLTQQAQIGQMRGWLDAWELPPNGRDPQMAWMGHEVDGRMPGMASPEDVATLRELPPAEMDVLFLQLMTTHHIAGVDMAQAILDRSDISAVEFLANAMAVSQQKEIEIMNGMLESMGAEPVTEKDDEHSSH